MRSITKLLFLVIIFTMALIFYVLNYSILLQIFLTFLLSVFLYIITKTKFVIIYLGLIINLSFLWLFFWLTDGNVSYLSDSSFEKYYSKTIMLETLFWSIFGFLEVLLLNSFNKRTEFSISTPLILSTRLTASVAFILLMLEVMLSSQNYFIPYADVNDTGTIAFELGCMFVALTALKRISNESNNKFDWRILIFEFINITTVLLIAIGSGKRLPLAYVVMAYMLISMKYYGKIISLFIFTFIAIAGYSFGILRDSMTTGSIDLTSLLTGANSSNQGAVLHASGAYLRIIDESIVDAIDRLISFLSNFIGALFLPLSFLPDVAQINNFTIPYYIVQGNGGFIGVYSFFFLDWLGLITIPLLLITLLSAHGRWINLAATIMILASPRWILYNVGPVFRIISLTIILVYIINFFCAIKIVRYNK